MKQRQPHVSHAGPFRFLIADDHELVRAGLRGMLAGDRELELIGEASNGREAVDMCRALQPNLALLDVRMPELDGLAATRAIKQECPHTSVIIITTHDHPDYLLAALQAGAAGYILKDVSRHDLLTAIRQVLRGEAILNGDLAVRALQQLVGGTRQEETPMEQLTPREREVLEYIVQGHTNREIAGRLSLSVGTVKIHVEHIIGKLGVSDRTQAAVRAVEHGVLGRHQNSSGVPARVV
jgi:DNA-binding NarL/FixJ family response regulator